MDKTQEKHQRIVFWLFIIAIISIPIFGSLEKLPIKLWDESRTAMNAWEMSKSSNWWVTTFDGQADMWNTKPPFLVWLQALMIKLIGLRPLALRLPVALAVFSTVLILVRFLNKQTGRTLFGGLVALILVTSGGYLCVHVARTGDFDGLLILFIVGYCLSFFLLLSEGKTKYFYWFFTLLALAVLTKSIAGLLMLPGLGVYALSKRKVVFLVKSPAFYWGALLCSLMIASFYLTREHYNPGYLKAVYENEIGGRYLKTLEENNSPFLYYIEQLSKQHFSYWFALAILGSGISFYEKDTKTGDIGRFSSYLVLGFLLIISTSQTKLDWYDAPIFPFMAILAGIGVLKLMDQLKIRAKWGKNNLFNASKILILIAVFALPYYTVVKREVIEAKGLPEEMYQYALSRYIIGNISRPDSTLEGQIIVDDEYIPHIEFYMKMAQEKGIHITRKYSNQVKVGDKILSQQTLSEKPNPAGLQFVKTYDYDGVRKYEVEQVDTTGKLVFGSLCNGG